MVKERVSRPDVTVRDRPAYYVGPAENRGCNDERSPSTW
jgi:hypothetical protein